VDAKTKIARDVKQLQKLAELSPQIENQLPLGFKFGLSKIQTKRVVDSLLNNKVIKEGYNENCFIYNYKLDSNYVSCYVEYEFYNDSLYHLCFEFGRDNVLELEKSITSKISKELGSKYSNNHYIWSVVKGVNLPLTFWIKDNKEVSLKKLILGLYLSYKNMPIEKILSDESAVLTRRSMMERMEQPNHPSIKNSTWDYRNISNNLSLQKIWKITTTIIEKYIAT
jgi:hypothetical protein